jgi:crotonobetainyl-CoA:carnitine CoA-transferase CaiB-like acyl-CoA transferase
VRSDDEWRWLAAEIGGGLEHDARFATLAGRREHVADLDAAVGAWTARREPVEITRTLQARGIAAFPVQDMEDVANDPHLEERGFFTYLDHPDAGVQQHTGIPWRYSDTPVTVDRPAPCLGEANAYAVCTLLGRSRAEYEQLSADGVLR